MYIHSIANVFQNLHPEAKKELLAEVCQNMIENQAWEAIAKLLIDQLGDNDAKEAIASKYNKYHVWNAAGSKAIDPFKK